MTTEAARAAALRGALSDEAPGARGIERSARNPGCQRLRALIMAGVSPATAAGRVYGDPPREGQSPFALALGNTHERQLFENSAARFFELYREAGRLAAAERRLAIVPELARGATDELAARRALTDQLFRRKLASDPTAPNVVVKPRVAVRILGVEHFVEPDALVAADGDPFYRVVEIKSYPDRDGKTDPTDIRGACRQAAVGVVALRQTVVGLGIADPAGLVPAVADLVLRAPGSLRPTLREMTLHGEVVSVERVLAEAPASLAELEAMLRGIRTGATLDDPDVLDVIPNHYRESCREHCALAAVCKRQAVACGSPVLLGSPAGEALAAAASIQRALELMEGRGAPPVTSEERVLGEQLQETLREYREVLAGGR